MGEADSNVSVVENVHRSNSEMIFKAEFYGGKSLMPPEKGKTDISKAVSGSKKIETSSISEVLSVVIDDTKIIKPPNDPEMLARATLLNSRLAKSIDVMAKNVVGLGFDVVDLLNEDEKRNITEELKEEIKKQSKELKNFLDQASDKPFEELMKLVKTDEEAVGNGYLEVIRNNDDEIVGLAHIPGRTMRIRKDDPGFVQVRGAKAKFFIPFQSDLGKSDLAIDPETGRDLNVLEDEDGKLIDFTREDMATEIIHFKLEHPSDDFYGIPRWIPAIPSITGNRLADVRNIAFMENDATPRIAILITGGNLDPASIEGIEKFIDLQGRGVEHASRVMVLQAESKKIGPQAGEPPKIELIPLTIGIKDDASFLSYRAANNDEIKEVFGISDLFYGMSRDINRAAASVAKQVTNEQEFEPERHRISHRLKHDLLPALSFETDLVTIKFVSPLINDLSTLADGISKAAAAGGLTPNNIKKMIGQSEYPKTPEYDWADFPVVISQKFMDLGAFGLLDDVDDMPERDQENREEDDEPSSEDENDNDENDRDANKELGTLAMMMQFARRKLIRKMKMNNRRKIIKNE